VLGWGALTFATLNLVLALAWIGLAVAIGREFSRKAQQNVFNVAPEASNPIADVTYRPGSLVQHVVAEDAFFDADPGDVLHLSARLEDGRRLPAWLAFDARTRRFIGRPPESFCEELRITVIASDVDGLEAASSFVMRCTVERGG
jgi:hypothetical protein